MTEEKGIEELATDFAASVECSLREATEKYIAAIQDRRKCQMRLEAAERGLAELKKEMNRLSDAVESAQNAEDAARQNLDAEAIK